MARLSKPDVSDEAVKAKTGKDWAEWFALLDAAGAQQMDHKAIVAWLVKEHAVGPWWQQKITVTYEQVRGSRLKHEMPGGFQISRSKTITAPLEEVYQSWRDETRRKAWLLDSELALRSESRKGSENTGAYIRTHWLDGTTTLDVDFYEKEGGRTQVVVQQNRLVDAEQAEERKAYWSEALKQLELYLEGHA